MLIFGEAHLRQILTSYASYYNESRTHLSLHKDAPRGRAVQRYGNIAATPVLSGCIIATRGYDFREGQLSVQLSERDLKGSKAPSAKAGGAILIRIGEKLPGSGR